MLFLRCIDFLSMIPPMGRASFSCPLVAIIDKPEHGTVVITLEMNGLRGGISKNFCYR